MRLVFVATLLVSAAAIAYEILLMRVLSIVQWHHFAYMIISLALLGYGASGTFIAINRNWISRHFELAFGLCALLFSATMVLCFALGQRVPFNALEVVWNPTQFLYLAVIYLVYFVPFFFAACCIGLAFTCRPNFINRIYSFDLLGAGLGAASIVGLLFLLSPQHALIALAIVALLASALVGFLCKRRMPIFLLQIAILATSLAAMQKDLFELRMSEYKPLAQTLEVVDTRVLAQKSSPLGLLTVVESPRIPFRHAPGLSVNTSYNPTEQLAVFTDGDSMSAITRFDGDIAELGYMGDVTAALPYALLDAPHVLILGAGGGADVLLALHNGASRIDAVELNPQMSHLVSDTFAGYAGHVYENNKVRLHTNEARGFVARSPDTYDLIQVALMDSFAASGSGVQALNESYLYTVEAIQAYLERIAPDGMLAITRWLKLPPRDNLKLVATVRDALEESGLAIPERHIAMIRSWNTSTLLVKPEEFTQQEVATIREFARSRSFDTAYYPSMPADTANRFNIVAQPFLFNGVSELLGEHPEAFIDQYKFDIEPATDDKPYFFHFFKWSALPEIIALRKRGGAGLIEWSYLILIATVVQAGLAGALLILLPLSRIRRNWPAGTAPAMGSYFCLLGIAFLLIEIAFIQKFILFLSHPLYAVAVILSAFLVFAGIGSASSGSLASTAIRYGRSPATVAVAGISAIAFLYLALLPTLFQQFIGQADSIKIAISVVLIAPLAFFMGMPFPIGLNQLTYRAPDFIPWAWGINGFASVLSAALATLLAIEFGFSLVVLIALLLYALAAAIVRNGLLPETNASAQ